VKRLTEYWHSYNWSIRYYTSIELLHYSFLFIYLEYDCVVHKYYSVNCY